MIEKIRQLFDSAQKGDFFTRIDSTHPIDIHIGRNDNYMYTMFIVSSYKPITLESSKIIDVFTGIRQDDNWGISFILIDNEYIEIFCHFCSDIIESSRNIHNIKDGIDFICKRYVQWQKMLKSNKSGLLSKSEVKGLIGELMFLKNYLFQKYDQYTAIKSWLGPDMLPQDFFCYNKWYEIKSISSNVDKVTISSIEQLDSRFNGELVVLQLDETNETDCNKIGVNSYYNELIQNIKDEECLNLLKSKLLNLGYYYREEYNQYCFRFNKYKKYYVNDNFPCLRRNNIPEFIVSAKYELSILNINNFLIEEKSEWN